uniref:Uncharacterized protein n=1 Tax=Timema bartmani TaxID=61472 RepID=A0A7R9HXX3_9NEOP|nr:unnamed protein product [Timema bartmani]
MALKWRPTNISHVVDDDADKLFKMKKMFFLDFHGMNYLGHFKQLLSNMDSYNWEGITQQPDKMVSLRSNFDQNNGGHKQIVHVYRSRKGGSYNTNKRSETTHRKTGHSVAVPTPRKGPQQPDVDAPSNILLYSIINKDINNKSSDQLLEKAEISPNRRLLGETEIYPSDSTTQHKSNLELYLQQIDMMDDKDKTTDSTTLKDEETNMNLTMISHHVQSYSSQASSQKHNSSFDFRQTYSTPQDSALDIAKLNVHNVYKPSFFHQIKTRNNEHKELHTQHSGGLQTFEESLEDPEVKIYNSQVYVNQYIYPFPESSQSNTSFYESPIRFRTKTHISINNMSHPNLLNEISNSHWGRYLLRRLALALLLTRPVLPRLASKEGPGAGSDSGREWVRWCEHPVVVMVVVLTHIAGNTHTAPPTPHIVSENYFTRHGTSYIRKGQVPGKWPESVVVVLSPGCDMRTLRANTPVLLPGSSATGNFTHRQGPIWYYTKGKRCTTYCLICGSLGTCSLIYTLPNKGQNVTGRPPIIPAVVCRRWVTLIGLLPSVADEDERVRVLGVISSLELLLLIALWTPRESAGSPKLPCPVRQHRSHTPMGGPALYEKYCIMHVLSNVGVLCLHPEIPSPCTRGPTNFHVEEAFRVATAPDTHQL